LSRRILSLVGIWALFVGMASAQSSRFNFNVGGGAGASRGDIGNFTDKSFQGGAGAGINLTRRFGVDAEYMYYNLSFTDTVLRQQVPDASGHIQSVTLNGIFKAYNQGKWGLYGIAGLGWYRRSVEGRSQVLVPGTVCQPSWALWGVTCTSNVITEQQILSSRTLNAAGYNAGGGITYKLPYHNAKFYMEVRYHHANHNDVRTSVLPITFGLRW